MSTTRPATTRGQLGDWGWFEDWTADADCADVVDALAPHFIGLSAVCTSWDSGELDPSAAGLSGWQVRGGHAVSPVIELSLTRAWPRSSCGFDEWYFFDVVPAFEVLAPVCNWGIGLADAPELREVPSGLDLLEQLNRYSPRAIVGDGRRAFIVARDEVLLAKFEEACRRRRTRG